MPFALLGFFLASFTGSHAIELNLLLLVVGCMIFARNAAMAFNRWQDRDIDLLNPRTAIREIPSGVVSSNAALCFTIMNAFAFIICTYFINPLCFYLSPIALLVILGYSYTKRFTFLCHVVLGIGLALAPIGAYIAVTGQFHVIPILLGLSVLFWVAGFDIIYALQDEEFDKDHQLNSIPVFLGRNKALLLARVFHMVSAGFIILVAYLAQHSYSGLDSLMWVGVGLFVVLLIYQHTLVKPNDLSKINLAFFTTNGFASLLFGSLLILDLFF